MHDIHTLSRTVGQLSIYRRDIIKSDGRPLSLYGYQPHNLPMIAQEASEVAKGGELRWHPLRKEWNVYAPHRQNRTFKPSAAADPLAPSQENPADTEIPFSEFELAIFENKFTSLHREAPVPKAISGLSSDRAKGHCDVIVYSPEPAGNLHTLGQDRRRLIVEAWIDRYAVLFSQGYKFVLPFENRGDEVGVTLHHPHGQIYAFPFIPDVQGKAAQAFDAGYDLASALKNLSKDFHITEAEAVIAYCPPYARFPFEVWLAPRRRVAGPWEFTEAETDGFAKLLGDITRRYDEFFERETPYMLSLHAAPAGCEASFHFTAQFYPLLRAKDRVKYLASVEQSTGVFTVDVMPDYAASCLRGM